jgi:hypothetical protein
MANGVGGRVRYCEDCGTRTCISPHVLCSACRIQRPYKRTPASAESIRRSRYRQRRKRILAGLPEYLEEG